MTIELIPKQINVNHFFHPPAAAPATPKDPTIERVKEVAGKVLFTFGLIITAGVILGLAGHAIGVLSVSVISLAVLLIIAHNVTMWGYSLLNGKPQTGPEMKIGMEAKMDLFQLAKLAG